MDCFRYQKLSGKKKCQSFPKQKIIEPTIPRSNSAIGLFNLDRKWTELHEAAFLGNFDYCVTLLVRAKTSLTVVDGNFINCKNAKGATALMVAADIGNFNILKLLLENGADIDAQDDYGWTAMMFACYNGDVKAVEILQALGASTSIANNDGYSANDLARDYFSNFDNWRA